MGTNTDVMVSIPKSWLVRILSQVTEQLFQCCDCGKLKIEDDFVLVPERKGKDRCWDCEQAKVAKAKARKAK